MAIRTNIRNVIPTEKRPRALLAAVGGKAFLVGNVIAQSVGRGRTARLKVLYALKNRVRLRPRLPIYQIAAREVDRWWETEAARAIKRALATARV